MKRDAIAFYAVLSFGIVIMLTALILSYTLNIRPRLRV
jgi:hypothetical protein